MKRIIYVAFIFLLGINIASAKPVTLATAKTIAENFYKQNSSIAITSITLVHTELSYTGLPLYYTFDINTNDGFVIVAAEDAIRPIVGYSTKSHSTQIEKGSNIGYWMEKTSAKINAIRKKGYIANEATAAEWTAYINNTPVKATNSTERQVGGSSVSTTLGTPAFAPLMQSTWNQSPYYNAYCPGSTGLGTNASAAVTGCVATTMAQIMRYWSYPAQGTGSHSYTQSPNSEGYPAQSANFGATTYDWASMPYANSAVTATTYSPIAQLMYQCGVSVNMHYDPTGSGAQVVGGNPSAQYSYVNYFSYNPNTIRGLYRSYGTNYGSATYYYTDAAWIDSVETDLNIGRCVQYVGDDSVDAGHTWVCDGYDSNGNLHMNWGWGGAYDGYFAVSDLTTAGGTADVFDPRYNDQMLKGIVPISAFSYDAGVPIIASPVSYYCTTAADTFSVSLKLQNYGSSALTACTVNYQLDGGSVYSQNWSGSLVSYQTTMMNLPSIYATPGTHTLVCYSSNPDGALDQNTANDTSTIVFTVAGTGTLPVQEGFETSTCPTGMLPNSNWNVSYSAANGVNFAITTNAYASGSQSCMLNNLSNVAGDTSILQTANSYSMPISPITFEAAYQQQATTNADRLQILVSTDCGNSWLSRKVITAATLASLAGGTSTSPYMPSPSQFTTYSVTLSATETSSPNVMFRWTFIADPTSPGNNLYIDNINIRSSTTGIENLETSVSLNLYPNPSTGKVNIDFNLSEQHNVSVIVTDMLGRTVETIASKSYQSGETTLAVGTNNAYQAGVYLVNINIDGQRISKKIIIQ